ncbi:dUTPase [compost metagenome]
MQARLELVDIWHFLLSSIIETTSLHVDWEWERLEKEVEILRDCSVSYGVGRVQLLDAPFTNNAQKVLYLSDSLVGCEWSWEELYKAYIGKVALNNFRQANGYKEGTYVKIWESFAEYDPEDGAVIEVIEREDNYFLEQILSELSLTEGALTYQAVYAKLGIEYMLRC